MTALGGCSRSSGLEIQPGSDVVVQKKDGVKVAGRLVEVKPEHVVVEQSEGRTVSVPRGEIATVRAESRVDHAAPRSKRAEAGPAETEAGADAGARPGPSAGADAPERQPAESPRYREVTLPAGTVLPLELKTAVASDSSHVEDAVRATLRRPVSVNGVEALPAGTEVLGHVTAANRSARVKGRAQVAFRFTSVDPPGADGRLAIRTDPISRRAPATRKQDAAKIGGAAAGGAIIGGILGGGDGAAKGAVIGGTAGTGVVLSTRGREVRLGPGAAVSARLAAPLTLRIPTRS